MNFLHILQDPAIIVIGTTFISLLVFMLRSYLYINKNLTWLYNFVSRFKKADMSYRFGEFDKGISQNAYISNTWAEFKNTLVFSESVAISADEKGVEFSDVSQAMSHIQTVVDPMYFFNADSLVKSKFNSNFMGVAPTLLTGMGPLFTFLNIAIAFTKVDFSTPEQTLASVTALMSSMQVAALCSVFAVGLSLTFMFTEKMCFGRMCGAPLAKVQELFSVLFDTITSEKFLIEILKETKVQNNSLSKLLAGLPTQFGTALEGRLIKQLVPYLENLLFGINTLNDSLKRVEASSKSSGDAIDSLF